MDNFGHSDQLSIFYTPPSEGSIENDKWVQIRPLSQVTHGSAVDFNIMGNSMLYVDLSRTRLQVKAKVVKPDGKPFQPGEFATTINMCLQTMWSQVEVSIQQRHVSSGVASRYAFKALIDMLLKANAIEQASIAANQMFYRDTAGAMESVDPEATPVNQGILLRNERIKDNKIVHMEGPLYVDIFQQNRLLLNGLQVAIRLFPNNDAFRLMSNVVGCRLEVMDMVLNVCYVKVHSDVMLAHNEALKSMTAKYFYDESLIKTYSISAGQFSHSVDNVFQGLIPKNVRVALVSSNALNGNYKKKPFNFQNYNLNFCAFYVDGQSLPGEALEPNFKSKNYTDAYHTVFAENNANGLTYKEYEDGYTIYTFELEQKRDTSVRSVKRRGHTKLEIRFVEALPESVTLIVYAKFPQILHVDESRKVILE